MNIKLASAILCCCVAMSCSVSEGQLIDRMLSKVGCGICKSANVCDTGCDTGCGSEIVTDNCGGGCGGLGILSRIKDRLAHVGCGRGCDAAPSCEPVVDSCGCEAAPSCGGGGLLEKLKARLSSIGNGCGCAAPADDCGCNVAPVVLEEPCGCDAAPSCGGLFGRLKGRLSSLGGGCGSSVVGDCGCGAVQPMPFTSPVVDSCGCDAPVADPCSSCGGNLLSRIRGKLSSIGSGCGCGAPVADCGCGTAPVVSPCDNTRGGPNLLGRLRGRQIFGKLRGGCDNGCGEVIDGTACGGCGSAATAITGTSGSAMSNEVMTEPPVINAQPTDAEPATDSGAIQESEIPAVDPNAFINRNGNVRG